MPGDQELSDREQRTADLIHQVSSSTRAPDSLRARVDAIGRRHERRQNPWIRMRTGLAGMAASVAVAVVLVIGFVGGTAAPSLAAVTALAGRGPAGPAPAPDAAQPTKLLSAAVGDLHFPDWQRQGGWRASGERTDTVGGRHVLSVYYTRGGTRLVYSIVASPTLAGSTNTKDPYVVRRAGSRLSVIWSERGHTCVLSGVGVSAQALWNLAASTF